MAIIKFCTDKKHVPEGVEATPGTGTRAMTKLKWRKLFGRQEWVTECGSFHIQQGTGGFKRRRFPRFALYDNHCKGDDLVDRYWTLAEAKSAAEGRVR